MRRALVTLHRWFGLFIAAFLFIAGLTGALIAWDHELDAWLNPTLFRTESRGVPIAALTLAERLEQDDPRLMVSYLELSHERGHTQLFSVSPRTDAATGKPFELDFNQLAVDPISGAIKGRRFWGAASLSRENLLPFLYKLHFSLHIPDAFGVELGSLWMGIVASVWFLDAFIALWISFPQWSAWRKSFTFRLRAGGYRLNFDLHRSGAVWLWPLLLTLALTAVAMNLGQQVVRPVVSLFSELRPDPFEAAAAASPEQMIEPRLTRAQIVALARVEAARMRIEVPVGAVFYAQEIGAYGVGFFAPGDAHGDLGLGNPWLYLNGQDGALLGANIPGTGSAGDLFMQLQFPLHSGRIAGLTGRIVVTLLGLAVAMLSVTGIVIWARKRRARKSSARKRVSAVVPLLVLLFWPQPGRAQQEAGVALDASAATEDVDAGTADTDAELDVEASTPAADAEPSEDAGGYAVDAALEADAALSALPDVEAAPPQFDSDSGLPLAPLIAPGATGAAAFAADPSGTQALPAEPVTVVIRARLGAREQLQKSSDAVTVVDLRQAKRRSSDLGEVLARVAGISLRRYGGLGSEFRFSLNGLNDAQIRIFVDGIPIDRVYAVGIANVPINLIQDVEIYRGVVPLRFGADALGGAVNLVTSAKYETALQASYQVGSFGTHRATLAGRYRHEPSGVIAGVDAFFDDADNDYKIDVEIPDQRGRLSPARVRRFHDAYRAYGVAAEAGVVDKPWARKLLARGFGSAYTKEIQNNVVMTVPYGEPHYGETILGGLLSYQNTFARRYDLDVVASYTYRTIDFVDKGAWVYDWHGERVRERRVHGEIESKPRDQTLWQHGAFGRATLDVNVVPGHRLAFTSSPNYATRTGDEQIQLDPSARDPLTAERELFKLVSGASYTLSLAPLADAPADAEARRPEHYRLENSLFAKAYVYRADSEEPLPGNIFRKRDKDKNAAGAGNALRVTLVDDFLLAKASYEFATRLPEADEVFGNGVLILANLELAPETSHNANLGPQLDLRNTKAGDFWVDVNGFLRDSRDLIVLLGNDRFFAYQNVYRARSMGIENSAKWTSPGRYVTLDAQLTYMDQRNVSSLGTFGDFKGDRIPNRPWLFASWGGFLRFEGVLWKKDRVEPFYQGRYVREFFRGWESVGLREFKQTVPSQISHILGVTYALHMGRGTVYGTFDVQNITDAKLYDSFGVQRPGRGYYFKLVGEL